MNKKSSTRKRGVILTFSGLQKLQNAKLELEVNENYGKKYTIDSLSQRTGLDPGTVGKVLDRSVAVDKRTIKRVFSAFNLELTESCYSYSVVNKGVDLGESICTSAFFGRVEELAVLDSWVKNDRCRLIAILGMGGIGKTTLSVKLAEQLQDEFEYVIWRSLREAPPVETILTSICQFLSSKETFSINLSESVGNQISLLLNFLRNYRCLIILDNAESILSSNTRTGVYREGYEAYGELFRLVGETSHQSCLVLTSREKPKEVASLSGEGLLVRSLALNGLPVSEGKKIFKLKGLYETGSECSTVIQRCGGNPLALKITATTIQDIFDGDISKFLKQETIVFGDICDILEQQFDRLPDLERNIMYWLAINREPIDITLLQEYFVARIPQVNLLPSLESLARRSLIEKNAALFTLQPVVMEYVTEKFIAEVTEEILQKEFILLKSHSLMTATALDYIKEAQVRLILQSVIDRLLIVFLNTQSLKNELNIILASLRENLSLKESYMAGNIINLLCHIEKDLSGYDFSRLTIWQADLRQIKLHDVNFQNANLAKSVFSESFGGIFSVAFSPDGKRIAMGDTNGEISLRQVADGQKILTCNQHTNWVTSLVFSPDGSILASSSCDRVVKLWDVYTGRCLKTLQDHDNEVWSVNFSPDGNTLVSSSDDNTVRLWDVSTGECKRIFQGHTNWVLSAVFSPDGQMLASGSDDNTVRLWNVSTGECKRIFQGHCDGIRSVKFSLNGQIIVSGSDDNTIKLWDVSSGKCLNTLQGHTSSVKSVAFNQQGDILASGSDDHTVKLWSLSTGECIKTFQGHTSWVCSVTFSPNSDILASGSHDQTVKIWSVSLGECLKTFQGYNNQLFSVAFSPDGKTLLSGGSDKMLRLWDTDTGKNLKTFRGHHAAIQSVAFCPDGQMVASGSFDRTVKLWDISTDQPLKTFQGHTNQVMSVAFSSDGKTLASGSFDQTVMLWDVNTGQKLKIFQEHNAGVTSVAFAPQGTMLASGATEEAFKLWDIDKRGCKKTFQEHASWAWSVAWSPDGKLLASASFDMTVKLWCVNTGECLRILQADTNELFSVAFSPDSLTIASCGQDYTVKLWNVSTGQCQMTFQGHTGKIWCVAFSPDNQTLASSGEDGTIRLWDVTTGECLKTLQAEKPYERMKITGVTGLTTATIGTLKLLGAA